MSEFKLRLSLLKLTLLNSSLPEYIFEQNITRYVRFYEIIFIAVGAMYVCMLYAILFLKLWSYVQVNMWCRLSVKSKNTSQGRIRRQSLSYTDLHCKYLKQYLFELFPWKKISYSWIFEHFLFIKTYIFQKEKVYNSLFSMYFPLWSLECP
jgi:hypothetical protein